MAKVSGIFHQRGIQMILASSWARPAILVAGKGRGGTFMPPTSKKLLRGGGGGCILLLGCSFVRPSVRSSRFLMHSITLEP